MRFWLINAFCFWAAEWLSALVPFDSEPAWVLAAALAAYCGVAVCAGASWHWLRARLFAVSETPFPAADAFLAFVPPTVLLAGRVRLAVAFDTTAAVAVLGLAALCFAVCIPILRSADESVSRGDPWFGYASVAYAWSSFGTWLVALEVKDVVSAPGLSSPLFFGSAFAAAAVALAWWSHGLRAAEREPQNRRREVKIAFAAANVIIMALFAARSTLWFPYGPSPENETTFADSIDGSTASSRESRDDASRVPVVLIVMDTTGARHLSVYGYRRRTTPGLEALARESTVFERAVADSCWTLPSHASLFTGLSPLRHGAHRHGPDPDGESGVVRAGRAYRLSTDHDTLAEILRDHGYATAAVASNFAYLDPAFQLNQGFSFYHAWRKSRVDPVILHFIDRRIVRIPRLNETRRPNRSAARVNAVALRWLSRHADRPFFLFLNYMEPHSGWGPHSPGLRYGSFRNDELHAQLPRDLRETIALYDSQIAALDRALIDLFDGLRALGVWQRALVIVTADHGESFGQHGTVNHGESLYEPETSIPLIVKYPSRPGREESGGARSPEYVQLSDVFATVLDVAKIPPPPGIDGRPAGSGSTEAISEFFTDPVTTEREIYGYEVARWQGDTKAIVKVDGSLELYDLAEDPYERNDLSTVFGDRARREKDRLRARYERLVAEARSLRGRSEPVGAATRARLEALGYVE